MNSKPFPGELRRPPEEMSEARLSHAWLPKPLNLKSVALAHTRAQSLDGPGDPNKTKVSSSAAEGRAPQ